jgi:hypothetical protein
VLDGRNPEPGVRQCRNYTLLQEDHANRGWNATLGENLLSDIAGSVEAKLRGYFSQGRNIEASIVVFLVASPLEISAHARTRASATRWTSSVKQE